MYSKILAANDGSPGSLKALDKAIALARQVSAELHMVTVEDCPAFRPASMRSPKKERRTIALLRSSPRQRLGRVPLA